MLTTPTTRQSLEKPWAPEDCSDPCLSGAEEAGANKRKVPQVMRIACCVALAVACVGISFSRHMGFSARHIDRDAPDVLAPPSRRSLLAVARACDNSSWLGTVVRDVKHLTASERKLIVAGYKRMKQCESLYEPGISAYDYFVSLHWNATQPNTETHAGWYFYPWHRAMLLRFTSELRRCTGDRTLHSPYWDWTDSESTDTLLHLSYMGPALGSVHRGYQVDEGNFRSGLWKVDQRFALLPAEKEYGAIVRTKGNGLQMCVENEGDDQQRRLYLLDTPYNPPDVDAQSLVGPFISLSPTGPPNSDPRFPPLFLHPSPHNTECGWKDLDCDRFYFTANQNRSVRCRHYAATLPTEADYDRCSNLPNYSSMSVTAFGLSDPRNPFATSKDYFNSYTTTFRACFEGIDPSDTLARGLERLGGSLHPPHGATHTHMGGSLATPTSPNDPIFSHLHWNVDRKFAEWQHVHGNGWFTNGPLKEKLDDPMPLFDRPPVVTLRSVLDTKAMGYTFDTLC